jgi:hypothetical protein
MMAQRMEKFGGQLNAFEWRLSPEGKARNLGKSNSAVDAMD